MSTTQNKPLVSLKFNLTIYDKKMPNEYSTVTTQVTNKSAILIIWVFSYLSVGIKFPTYTIESKLHSFQQQFSHEKHQTHQTVITN